MALLRTKIIKQEYIDLVGIDTYNLEYQLLDQEWKQKSEDAKAAGIATHEYIHNLFCTSPYEVKTEFSIPTDLYKVQLDTFMTCDDGIFVEQKLEFDLNSDYKLIGIPDCFVIHDGIIDIYDWKTSEEPIKFKSMFDVGKKSTKKLKYPLSNYDSCDGVIYMFQVSIYMWMLLQLRPDLKPGNLYIVWIKENKVKQIYPVEYLEKQVDKLLKWHVKNLKLQEEMRKCREIKY